MKEQSIHEHLDVFGFGISQTEIQLMETILGRRAKDRIEKLIQTFDIDPDDINHSSANVLQIISLPSQDLIRRGLTPNEAAKIQAAYRLGLRAATVQRSLKINRASCPEDLVRIISPLAQNLRQEIFAIIMLNARNEVISHKVLSIGGLTSAPVSPATVFQAAILANAVAIAVWHPHLSGNPSPSKDDIAISRTLLESSRLLHIPLLDHIVYGCGTGKYYSFAEHGFMNI